MSLDALRRDLASGDEQATRRTVLACGEGLQSGRVEDSDALVAALLPLATHASPILRQALADICDALPERAFDGVHGCLLADRDPFVAAAARAAGDRYVRARRQKAKSKKEEKRVVDELDQLEGELGKGARRLAERAVERGISLFAANLAHEVLKSERPVLSALEQLEADVVRPERSPLLLQQQLAAAGERARFAFAMVRRARDYAERYKPIFKGENLASIVAEAHGRLVQRLGARGAKLAFTSDVDPALQVDVDAYALHQALQNVLQNAAEAYAPGAARLPMRVSASLGRGGSEVTLVVADEGCGIDPAQIASLFVPFGSRKPGGTGLGMLIVRRTIEEVHGGRLQIESGEGNPDAPRTGTRILMTLPTKQRRA